jgi:hypothetical protein
MWLSMVLSWSPNTIFFAGIAYLSHDWRTLSRVTSILTIPPLLMLLFVTQISRHFGNIFRFSYESPRWLAQKGRLDEAKSVVQKIARFDGRKKRLDLDELEEIVEREREVSLLNMTQRDCRRSKRTRKSASISTITCSTRGN